MANWISIFSSQMYLPGVRQSFTPALPDAILSHECLTAEMENISPSRTSPRISASITQNPQHTPAACLAHSLSQLGTPRPHGQTTTLPFLLNSDPHSLPKKKNSFFKVFKNLMNKELVNKE